MIFMFETYQNLGGNYVMVYYCSSEEGMDDDGEPEFIDLAELGSKVTSRSPGSAAGDEAGSVPDELSAAGGMEDEEESEMEDGEELWICRFCDRAFDSEVDLTAHEKQHS